MKTKLRIVRESIYHLNRKDETEYKVLQIDDKSYIGMDSDKVIPRVRDRIKNVVRGHFEVGDKISEEFYDVNEGNLKKESSLHPVLEYKFEYRRIATENRRMSSTIWEVYYMELDVPDVVKTYKV